jgi:hypothetical protein
VKFLTGLPFTFLLELFFIYIPLAYHAFYGIYIWYRGEGNVSDYPWTGNWLYTAQRLTGIIALIYMGYHTYTMRFSGVHLFNGGYYLAYDKVHNELMAPTRISGVMRRRSELSALRGVNCSGSGEIFRPKFLIPGYTLKRVVIQRS